MCNRHKSNFPPFLTKLMSKVPFKDAATGCIFLDEKTSCGWQYYGYPIKSGLIAGLDDYPSFVAYLSSEQSAMRIASTYGCQRAAIAPQVASQRYRTSILCAQLVQLSVLPVNQADFANISGGGCPLPVIANKTLYPMGPLIGREACDIANNGLTDIIQSCSNTTAALLHKENRICESITSYCNKQECIPATEAESKTCGFQTRELAISNCPFANDTCCTDFLKALQTAKPSSNATIFIVAVLASSIIFVLLILTVIFVWKNYYARKFYHHNTYITPYSSNADKKCNRDSDGDPFYANRSTPPMTPPSAAVLADAKVQQQQFKQSLSQNIERNLSPQYHQKQLNDSSLQYLLTSLYVPSTVTNDEPNDVSVKQIQSQLLSSETIVPLFPTHITHDNGAKALYNAEWSVSSNSLQRSQSTTVPKHSNYTPDESVLTTLSRSQSLLDKKGFAAVDTLPMQTTLPRRNSEPDSTLLRKAHNDEPEQPTYLQHQLPHLRDQTEHLLSSTSPILTNQQQESKVSLFTDLYNRFIKPYADDIDPATLINSQPADQTQETLYTSNSETNCIMTDNSGAIRHPEQLLHHPDTSQDQHNELTAHLIPLIPIHSPLVPDSAITEPSSNYTDYVPPLQPNLSRSDSINIKPDMNRRPSLTSGVLVRVSTTYDASLPDELNLVLHETLVMHKAFDDGWALGHNPRTGVQGVFPLMCVDIVTSESP